MRENRKNVIYTFSIIAIACVLYTVSAGLRSIYGIILDSLKNTTDIPVASLSFSIAMGQLMFGISQPVFGIIALKKSNKFVLSLGSLFMSIGLFAIPFCSSLLTMNIFLGILLPIGTGAVSFSIIMSAITPKIGTKTSITASGFINASSGLGAILFPLATQISFSHLGQKTAMQIFAVLMLLLIPLTTVIGQEKRNIGIENIKRNSRVSRTDVFGILKNKFYIYLMIGFFTCGFHMALIEIHLYSQIQSYQLSSEFSAFSFSAYGLTTIFGSLLSGIISNRFSMKNLLAMIYGSRVFLVIIFTIIEKNSTTILIMAISLGLTGASTVTPTAGIINELFGQEKFSILFGIVFVCHQFGSFISAWIGGIIISTTGQYSLVWGISAILSLLAMFVSSLIFVPTLEK